MPIAGMMAGRVRWLLVCLLVAAGGAPAVVRDTVSPARHGAGRWLLAQWPTDENTKSTEIATVPSDSMEPTLPVGSRIELDYGALKSAPPNLGDIVVFNPPRSAELDRTLRCGARHRPGQMCAKPVRRLAHVKFLKRVVGLPGDRLRLRHGRLIRNGVRVDEPFADRAQCGDSWPECHFPRQITVPRNHYFVLGDNRGRAVDSRYWGPVARRAFLARVVGCTIAGGERCGDQPREAVTAMAPQ